MEFYSVGTYDVTLTASTIWVWRTPASERIHSGCSPATGTFLDTWEPGIQKMLLPMASLLNRCGGWVIYPDIQTRWHRLVRLSIRKNYNPGTLEVRRTETYFYRKEWWNGNRNYCLAKADDNGTVAGAPGTILKDWDYKHSRHKSRCNNRLTLPTCT